MVVVDDPPAHARTVIEDGRIEMPIREWQLALDRERRTATVRVGSRVDRERLAHPVLGWAGSIFARWDGRIAFHAGVFVHGGRAWMLMGGRESGKSSTLAGLSRRDVPVLADDVVVLDGDDVLLGPRCVDLRPGVPEALGVSDLVQTVRDGEAQRLGLGEAPARVPLGGWFVLDWGDAYATRPVGAVERIRILHEQLTLNLEMPSPERVLAVADLPAWRLVRPAGDGVRALDRVFDELLGVLAGVV